MRNASMKVLKNLVCCAAFICLMFVLAMPAHAASKADELLQLVNAERAQAGVAPLSMGSSALNAAAQARAKELTVNYSYNRPNGSREFTILPEYGVDDVSVGENYWAAAEDASDVVAAWNRYDFFKERMLDKDATSVGIGYYEGGEYGNYWVMIFTYARGTSENGFAQEVLALVNAERAKEKLAPLAMGDAKLQAAADERAKEVAKVASHTRPDGTNCFTVLKEYGVSDTATGENAVVVNCRRADIIVGPIGIVIADSLLGEITPAMAAAVCQSSAARVLIPINHCDNIVVGVPDQPIGQLVAAAVEKVKELIR